MLAPIRPQRGSTNHSRPILFFHIPKTGGSSVSVAFQRVLGARKVLVPLYGSDREIIGHALNQAALSASPLFMSGHISPGIFDSHPWIIRTTVVRDPVDLLISQFCYSYKTRYQSPINLEFLNIARAIAMQDFPAKMSSAGSIAAVSTIPRQGFSADPAPGPRTHKWRSRRKMRLMAASWWESRKSCPTICPSWRIWRALVRRSGPYQSFRAWHNR